MQRMVKKVVRVHYTENGETLYKDIAAKTAAEAIAVVIDTIGHVPEGISTEDLGAKIAVVADSDFYRIATFKDIKID